MSYTENPEPKRAMRFRLGPVERIIIFELMEKHPELTTRSAAVRYCILAAAKLEEKAP